LQKLPCAHWVSDPAQPRRFRCPGFGWPAARNEHRKIDLNLTPEKRDRLRGVAAQRSKSERPPPRHAGNAHGP